MLHWNFYTTLEALNDMYNCTIKYNDEKLLAKRINRPVDFTRIS